MMTYADPTPLDHSPVVAIAPFLILLSVFPMIYLIVRIIRAVHDPSAGELSSAMRRIVPVFFGLYIVAMAVGFLIGYTHAGSDDPRVAGAIGLYSGAATWMVLCWITAPLLRLWREMNDGQSTSGR